MQRKSCFRMHWFGYEMAGTGGRIGKVICRAMKYGRRLIDD